MIGCVKSQFQASLIGNKDDNAPVNHGKNVHNAYSKNYKVNKANSITNNLISYNQPETMHKQR
ncbi:MAG TPA: hypothetical protein PLI21_05590, partial [Methanomassiliicoccaceae archaeon]|nr:hypothetical protein [Methanomassiliicoccaceae archaeon]